MRAQTLCDNVTFHLLHSATEFSVETCRVHLRVAGVRRVSVDVTQASVRRKIKHLNARTGDSMQKRFFFGWGVGGWVAVSFSHVI